MRYTITSAIVLVLAVILLSTRITCESENIETDLLIYPKSGIEPLEVRIKLSARSNLEIKSVKLDLDGDQNYEIQESSISKKEYQIELTHIYTIPPQVSLSYESSLSVTVNALVEGELGTKQISEQIQIFPRRQFSFSLLANICSGPPPLEVRFYLNISCADCNFSIDCEGDGIYDYSQRITEFVCNFAQEGLYPSTISISDQIGNFALTEFFFCVTQAQSKMSRFIEVLSKIAPSGTFTPPVQGNSRISDVFFSSSGDEYIAVSGVNGMMIVKNRKIFDILFDAAVANSNFAKFFEDAQKNIFLYFSSQYGTFKWIEKSREIVKLSDRSIKMFYPLSGSYIVFDHINQEYGFCWNETIQSCESFFLEDMNFYSDIAIFSYNSTIYAIISDSLMQDKIKVIEFPSFQTLFSISRDSNPDLLPIYKYDYLFSPFSFVTIPSRASDRFQLISGNNIEEHQTSDPVRIKINTVSFVDQKRILFGTGEFPCQIGNHIRSCNKLMFNRISRSFENIEGENEIKDSYKKDGRAYMLTDNKLEILFPYFSIPDSPYGITSLTIPNDFVDFFYTGKELYIVSRNSVLFFRIQDQKIKFLSHVYLPDGEPSSIYKIDDLIFVAISDDLRTSEKKEGKIVTLQSKHDEIKELISVSSEEISQALFRCLFVRRLGSEIQIFVCNKNKLIVLSDKGNKIMEVVVSESEYLRDVQATNRAIYTVSDVNLYTILPDGKLVDTKKTVMQFFKIDIDEDRGLMFTAEGQDHNFRVFDISETIPREITRVSVDYGTYNDVASYVFHSGKYVYLSSYYAGLLMFDITNPSSPQIRKKTYFDEFSISLGRCMAGDIIVCMSSGSIIFLK